jgi:hypothetical protein
MNLDATITDSMAMALIRILYENPDCVVVNIPLQEYGFSWFYLYSLTATGGALAVNLTPTFLLNAMETEYTDNSLCSIESAPNEFRMALPEIDRNIQKVMHGYLMENPILLRDMRHADSALNRINRKNMQVESLVLKRSPGFPDAASSQT